MSQRQPSTADARPIKRTHGGRRVGAGAPKGNMNAFKHGLCADKYDQRLLQASHSNYHRALGHMHYLVSAYHSGKLSRTRRAHLIQQAGLAVLTTWYGLCQAIREEQSR